MENSKELSEEEFWKGFIKKHQNSFIALIIGCICLFVGALLVLFWFIESSPLGGQGTWTFDRWTLNYIVGFFILIILWELLFVGIPAGLFIGVGGYIWWSNLPEEEKKEFKAREKKESHKTRNWGGGGGFNFFVFIAFCIYIAVDGNYNVQFGSQPYSYWIYSWFLAFMWIIIVLGIPVGIILLIVYFTVWRKKSD